MDTQYTMKAIYDDEAWNEYLRNRCQNPSIIFYLGFTACRANKTHLPFSL